MNKAIYAVSSAVATLALVGFVAAAFIDTGSSASNLFQAGTLDLQLSETDSNADGIADTGAGWADDTTATWTSPTNWAPGETFSSVLFLRDAGSVDIETLEWDMSSITRNTGGVTGTANLDDMVILTVAWYDRNANGVDDGAAEDLLPALIAAYDTDASLDVTLAELYTGMSTSFNIESVAEVLPGSVTNATIGGASGTGKGLMLTWEFDSTADNSYQDTNVTVDFDFNASNL